MRVLGIDIRGSDMVLVVLRGNDKHAAIERPEPGRIACPQVGPDEADNLLILENQLVALISQVNVERVGVVKAVGAGMYSASPLRVKIECLVQLAAKRNNLPCDLVSPQTLSKAEKITIEGGEALKNAIEALNPKYAHRAAYCAWSVLHAAA